MKNDNVPSEKISVIYPFSNFEEYPIPTEEQIKKKERYIVWIANYPEKRWTKGYSLLKRIVQKGHIKVIHIGHSSISSSSNIINLGYLNEQEFVNVVRKAKACVHPSLFDAFGVAPLDALNLGTLPVVSSNCGISELMPDEFVASDVDDFCTKLREILDMSAKDYESRLRKMIFSIRTKTSKQKSIKFFHDTIINVLEGGQ